MDSKIIEINHIKRPRYSITVKEFKLLDPDRNIGTAKNVALANPCVMASI